MKKLIKSISFDQHEIINWIQELYEPIDLDPTYGKGNFYLSGRPKYCSDLNPECDCDTNDYKHLPFKNNSLDIRAIMFDPPFLATTGPSLYKETGNVILKRFKYYRSETELVSEYDAAIREFSRILKPGKFLYFKCQDKVSGGKQYFTHNSIYNFAIKHDFVAEDLFVLLAKNRIVANWQRKQKHARKYHCYFWVFRKR